MLTNQRVKELKKEINALFRGSKKSNQLIRDHFNDLPDDTKVGDWNTKSGCPMYMYLLGKTSASHQNLEIAVLTDVVVIDQYGANVCIDLPELGKCISCDNAFRCDDDEGNEWVTAKYVKNLIKAADADNLRDN